MQERKTINDPVLGELVYNECFTSWYGKLDDSGIRVNVDSNPVIGSNIENIKRFIEWFAENKEHLNKKLVYELGNHDLIHGENFIENIFDLTEEESEKEFRILDSKVEASLKIVDISSLNDKLVIGVSTGGYTGDHVVDVGLNEKYEVLTMEL